MLKTIPLLLKTMQCPINKPQSRLPGPWSWKKLKKNDENFQKPEKKRISSKKKMLKFVILKSWNLIHGN